MSSYMDMRTLSTLPGDGHGAPWKSEALEHFGGQGIYFCWNKQVNIKTNGTLKAFKKLKQFV